MPARELAGRRWDPQYWLADPTRSLRRAGHSLRPLGDFVDHLTYGPIITGRRPTHQSGGIRVIGQVDFCETGLAPTAALRVAPGSDFDPARSRVLPRDLLLPRSGAGSLGQNRLAVYVDEEEANIGCFVDLVRLAGINPFYVWLFLRTGPGWGQIRRVINGVGMPNISFAEIRSLQVPLVDGEEQEVWEGRYSREVLPHHRRREKSNAEAQRAAARFRVLLQDLTERHMHA
jgi:hypothetical protein